MIDPRAVKHPYPGCDVPHDHKPLFVAELFNDLCVKRQRLKCAKVIRDNVLLLNEEKRTDHSEAAAEKGFIHIHAANAPVAAEIHEERGNEVVRIVPQGKMRKVVLAAKLEETLEELKTREPDEKQPWRARILLVGSEVDDSGLVKLIEECGAYVCCDRFCFGSYPGREPIELKDDEDALTQVCRHYIQHCQCPRMMNQEKVYGRKKYVADLAKEYGADGIIYEQVKFCDPWAYERMLGSAMLQADYHYPVLSVDRPYNVAASVGQMRTRVQAFVESVEIKKIQRGGKA